MYDRENRRYHESGTAAVRLLSAAFLDVARAAGGRGSPCRAVASRDSDHDRRRHRHVAAYVMP
jgi:hypothetical protein